MKRFKLTRLSSRTNDDLIAEIQRVSALIPEGPLTLHSFEEFSKVHPTTLRARFGGWKESLEAAGLGHRFNNSNAPLTRSVLIAAMQRAAKQLGKRTLTKAELYRSSTSCARALAREFPNWQAALEAAGLEPDTKSTRYSDEECFENLLTVWTHYGRAPFHKEMRLPPSRVGPKAYIIRWGTWLKALDAFVERSNQDSVDITIPSTPSNDERICVPKSRRTSREIPLGLRYKVLLRDGNRCLLCGRGPNSDSPAEIHVDHIKSWSSGGETILENLRILCRECNLGKGAHSE